MSKRLGVDLRCVTEGEPGGIATYTRELLPRLAQQLSSWEILGLITGLKSRKPNFPFPIKSFRKPNKLINFSLISFKSPKLDAFLNQSEVFFSPTPKYIALQPQTKFVMTIHDLSFIEHPEYFTRRQRFWHHFLNIKKLLTRADRIITVSKHTASDVEKFLPGSQNKIREIYSGVDHVPEQTLTKLANLPEKYFLAFAPPEPRKNIINLLKAQKIIFVKTGIPLVLVGSGKFPEQIGVIKKPYLNNQERWQVLANAFALIYPSIYEGFGFPPLEAFKFGVPVIASQVTSLPEVLGPAAHYIDPWDPSDLARAMQVLSQSKDLKQNLIALGYNQVKQYNWEACAQQTAEVFNELI